MKKLYLKKSKILEAKVVLYRILMREKAEANRGGAPLTPVSTDLLRLLRNDPHLEATINGVGNGSKSMGL